MFVHQLADAIASAPTARLDELSRLVWQGVTSGALTEDDAGRLAEEIHARHSLAKASSSAVGGTQRLGSVYPPRKVQRPPDRNVAIERRRRLAASGPLPPALAARFTTSEAAVMRIVGDECRDHGRCVLPIDAIAARAGVGRTTVQNALRLARFLGMIEVQERRQHRAPSLPNRIVVVDREWRQWLERGPRSKGGGFRKSNTTETSVLSEREKAASDGQNQQRMAGQKAGRAVDAMERSYARCAASRPSNRT